MTGSVYSVSLGQCRQIVFRIWKPISKDGDRTPLIRLDMPHGSMLRMFPLCNKYLTHCVPAATKKQISISNATGYKDRVNITFRNVNEWFTEKNQEKKEPVAEPTDKEKH